MPRSSVKLIHSYLKVLPLCSMFSNTEWQFESFPEDEYQRTADEVFQLAIDELLSQKFEQIEPVFNRDGWYFDRINNHSWYEWKGTAWKAEVDQFKWELDQHNARILEAVEVEAIKTLIVYGSCNLELRQLLWDHDNKVITRNIYRWDAKLSLPETDIAQWLEEFRESQPTDCG